MLEHISRSSVVLPPRILLYGTEGIGKSTFGSGAPKPIFIPTEDGLRGLNVDCFPLCTRFESVLRVLDALLTEPNDYQTVVLDSADACERLIHQKICRDAGLGTIEEIGGGYGKGYVAAARQWEEVIQRLQKLNHGGRIVVLLAHAQISKFEDPMSRTYDRYHPRMHKTSCALLTEWCDIVAFACYQFSATDSKKDKRVYITSNNGQRMVRVVGSPVCMAKNRYGLQQDFDLSWSALYDPVLDFQKGSANGTS